MSAGAPASGAPGPGTLASGIVVVHDGGRDIAVLVRAGIPLGTAFTGVRQGDLYIDAGVAASWFVFGARLMGLDPSEIDQEVFVVAQERANGLLVHAAKAALRGGVSARESAAGFYEAAFRGQLPAYELAIARLRVAAPHLSSDAIAAALNAELAEWSWQVQCALPAVEIAIARAAS